MVGPPGCAEPRIANHSPQQEADIHECQPDGVGHSHERPDCPGTLVPIRSQEEHQLPGASDHFLGTKAFLPLVEGEEHFSLHGQHDGQSIRQPPGGTRSSFLQVESSSMFQWAEHNLLSLRSEHIPGVKNTMTHRLSRKELDQWLLHPPVPHQEVWVPDSVSLCMSHQHPPAEVLLKEPLPVSRGHRRPEHSLAEGTSICLPSHQATVEGYQ